MKITNTKKNQSHKNIHNKTRKNPHLQLKLKTNLVRVKGHGPLILSAPHIVKTVRKNTELHDSEDYVKRILNKIYKKLGPEKCTILTWNYDYIKNNNLYPRDQNHIKTLNNSWFKILKKIKAANKCKVCVHIDIHGMSDKWFLNKKNYINVGIGAMEKMCPKQAKLIKKQLVKIMEGNNVNLIFNIPFKGFSSKYYTISHQGLLHNYKSFQFELNRSYRKKIVNNKKTFATFLDVIVKISNFINTQTPLKKKCFTKKLNKKLHKLKPNQTFKNNVTLTIREIADK